MTGGRGKHTVYVHVRSTEIIKPSGCRLSMFACATGPAIKQVIQGREANWLKVPKGLPLL